MGKIKVLDCTLRDGGYCNQWNFGYKNIKRILNGLTEADIDIVECGFLTNAVIYHKDFTKYTNMNEINVILPQKRDKKLYVCMINYGEFDIVDLPAAHTASVDGFRIAFHKKDMNAALELCRQVKDLGYKVFIQAMVSLTYSDEEFLTLIKNVNKLEPYSFYIVDSFGVMKKNDLIRLFYLVDHNLNPNISVGYHSHNNLQLAYANAQALVNIRTTRDLIIDTSIFGMGRGAGNLNTELFIEYLNDNFGSKYFLKPILALMDEIIDKFYQKNYWGYSLPNYLSAKHNTHPNYAKFLDEKKTLTIENMDEIFELIEEPKRFEFDQKYIQQLYEEYLETGQVQENRVAELKSYIKGKNILLIAPGRSSIDEKEKIQEFAKLKNVVTISINFDYEECCTDFVFLSNLRRFRKLDSSKYCKCIVTSNISASNVYLQTKYHDLLMDNEIIRDNAGMMLIKYMIRLEADKIYLAGLDGYSLNPEQDFANPDMNSFVSKKMSGLFNQEIQKALLDFRKYIDIEFLTTPRYILID